MKYKLLIILACLFVPLTSIFSQGNSPIYMPLGDSYTIGEGLPPAERFPNQVVQMLNSNGIDVQLGPNPAETGWTCTQLIDNELPLFRETKPTVATLLIGVNDWVQGVNEATFAKQLKFIIKEMLQVLPSNKHLFVLAIPDFSATPEGKKYGKGRDISAGITQFNKIIKEVCQKQHVTFVDIFALTQQMANNPELIALDGLHPSKQEYELWAKEVVKQMAPILKK